MTFMRPLLAGFLANVKEALESPIHWSPDACLDFGKKLNSQNQPLQEHKKMGFQTQVLLVEYIFSL